jgi:hypothetical protein
VPTVAELLAAPYGLFVLGGEPTEADRRAIWDVVAQTCESLYLLGPLSGKPGLAGPVRVWLLECALPERAAGLVEILRRDAHAVHAIGPVDDALLPKLVQAALSGCVAVLEVPGDSAASVLERLRGAVEPDLLWAALREVVFVGEPRRVWSPTPAIREAGMKGAPSADLTA